MQENPKRAEIENDPDNDPNLPEYFTYHCFKCKKDTDWRNIQYLGEEQKKKRKEEGCRKRRRKVSECLECGTEVTNYKQACRDCHE